MHIEGLLPHTQPDNIKGTGQEKGDTFFTPKTVAVAVKMLIGRASSKDDFTPYNVVVLLFFMFTISMSMDGLPKCIFKWKRLLRKTLILHIC